MPENTKEKDIILKNLDYIGLNLEELPDFLTTYKDVDFRPSKAYEENNFKIYRYINLREIEILLTPTNRLNTITEKYMSAVPLAKYLNTDDEENIILYATLLKMFEHINKSIAQAVGFGKMPGKKR